jgi:hypothetical protein
MDRIPVGAAVVLCRSGIDEAGRRGWQLQHPVDRSHEP